MACNKASHLQSADFLKQKLLYKFHNDFNLELCGGFDLGKILRMTFEAIVSNTTNTFTLSFWNASFKEKRARDFQFSLSFGFHMIYLSK